MALRFTKRRKLKHVGLPTHQLKDEQIKVSYQEKLALLLPSAGEISDPNMIWTDIKSAMKSAFEVVLGKVPQVVHNQWISDRSVALINERKSIPSDRSYDKQRRSLKRKLTKSLRMDREQWWTDRAKEMEKAASLGNSRSLFQLIRKTGSRRVGVSETISEKDGSQIISQERRLHRWAEHFQEQFSWPNDSVELVNGPSEAEWDVETGPPTRAEVDRELRVLKREKAAGPDGLPPAFFKDGGESLITALTDLLGTVWKCQEVPEDWRSSVIIPIFKKGSRVCCENHRGISLVSVASKLLTGIILRRLVNARERQIRENQAGFRPGRGCIDHIFTLRQILEHRHSYKRPTLVVFLDLKAAFDSVDRTCLWHCLSLKGVPQIFINLLKSLYSETRARVRVYGELSPEFTTESGVRQGCPLSPFLFNFVMDILLETALTSSDHSGV